MKSTLNNILAIGGFLLLVGFAYYLYTQQGSGVLNNTSTSLNTINTARSNQIVQRLSSIKEISLNGDIFSDPEFRALQDYSTPITPSSVGKSNPFE